MGRLEWIVICEYALVDKANKLSLLGEFTSVFFREFPSSLPVLYVVTRWKGEVGAKFSEQVQVLGGDGTVLAKNTRPVVELKTERITNITKFELLKVPHEGEYSITVSQNGVVAGKERFFARPQAS